MCRHAKSDSDLKFPTQALRSPNFPWHATKARPSCLATHDFRLEWNTHTDRTMASTVASKAGKVREAMVEARVTGTVAAMATAQVPVGLQECCPPRLEQEQEQAGFRPVHLVP